MRKRFRQLAKMGVCITLLVGCTSSSPPPLITEPEAESTAPLAGEATVAAGATQPGTPAAISTMATTTLAVTTLVSNSDPESVKTAIRSAVATSQQEFYEEILKLPNVDTAKIYETTLTGSPMGDSARELVGGLIESDSRVREGVPPVNVVKVGKIELVDDKTALVELCVANNLVVFRTQPDGTEVIESDTLASTYTTEEWVFSEGIWKGVVLRKQETQEGSQCDRLIP